VKRHSFPVFVFLVFFSTPRSQSVGSAVVAAAAAVAVAVVVSNDDKIPFSLMVAGCFFGRH
jgi:predicted cation transporter